MEAIKAIDPLVPIILLTAYSTVPLAREALGRGAFSFVPKEVPVDELVDPVRRAINTRFDTLRRARNPFTPAVGVDPAVLGGRLAELEFLEARLERLVKAGIPEHFLVDVATGWASCAGLRDKRAQTVLAALRRLQGGLPFELRGLDSDCGSEFLNSALISYCANQHITFTRGRPYRKNDGCHVEQKNRAVVRRLLGYQRLEAAALPPLERVQ